MCEFQRGGLLDSGGFNSELEVGGEHDSVNIYKLISSCMIK